MGKKNNTKKEWTQEDLERVKKGPATLKRVELIKKIEEALRKKKLHSKN